MDRTRPSHGRRSGGYDVRRLQGTPSRVSAVGDSQMEMNQLEAERIASERHANYGPVSFYVSGRKWIVRGYDCYDRVVEISVR